jgi:dihydroxyacetone kinase-like protein
MEKILRDDLPKLFEKAAAVMDAKSGELCAMDARMGDGDLGLTMKRGFDLLPDALAQAAGDPADRALMKAGMKMASAAPSTMAR